MRPRRKTSQRAASRSFTNGGSRTARSLTVWRKPAIGYSPSPNCRRANGGARAPRTRSIGCTRSSNAGSRPRPSCPQQRLPHVVLGAPRLRSVNMGRCRCRAGAAANAKIGARSGAAKIYFRLLSICGFRKRTPSPPPLSSTKSIPTLSNARRMAASFASVIGISPSTTSALRIVATPTFEARAKSRAVHRISARAARI